MPWPRPVSPARTIAIPFDHGQDMLGIFISYRRQDAKGYAGRLADDLEDVFGQASIFRDIDTLVPGTNFQAEIDRAIRASGVVLVLIGKDWSTCTGPDGRRRLDDESDPLRHEIRTALADQHVKVIPVLLEGANVPLPESLPADIRRLVDLHAFSISDQRWRSDVAHLVEVIDGIPGMTSLVNRASTRKGSRSSAKTGFLVGAAVVVAGMLVSSGFMMSALGGPTLFGLPATAVVLGVIGLLGGALVLYATLIVILGLSTHWVSRSTRAVVDWLRAQTSSVAARIHTRKADVASEGGRHDQN